MTRPTFSRKRLRNDPVFTRADVSLDSAADMAFENAGLLPVELSRPATEVYRDFLTDLILIDGFVGVRESRRYSLTIQVGRLFVAMEVAHKAVGVIHSTFYPTEDLEIQESDGGKQGTHQEPQPPKP